MARKVISITYCLIILLPVIYLIRLNLKQYYFPQFITDKTTDTYINKGVYHQLNFIRSEIEKGEDDDMQSIYPEGYFAYSYR